MNAQTIALDRFGLGARPDEALPADPKAWLHAQLGGFDPRPAAIAAAPTRQEVATQLADYFEEIRSLGGKAARKAPAAVLARPQPAAMTTPPAMTAQPDGAMAEKPQDVAQTVQQYIRKAS